MGLMTAICIYEIDLGLHNVESALQRINQTDIMTRQESVL